LIDRGGRLLRVVNREGVQNAQFWVEAKCLEPFRKAGRLVGTRVLSRAEAEDLGLGHAAMVLEHERIPFVGYPYEWPAEMLAAAGELTLDLAEALLGDGLGLKDATPFNVLFRGAEPVFVDALSVEQRMEKDPIWLPLAQFERTFVYPLLAEKFAGVGLRQTLGVAREGIEPEQMVKLLGPVRKWRPAYLGRVTIPAWLSKGRRVEEPGFYHRREARSADQARFILHGRLRGSRKALRRAAPAAEVRSVWSEYQGQECHYDQDDRTAKRRFVEQALRQLPAHSRVLDIGANLGEYSRMAAEMGHQVVSIDLDAVSMGRLWRQAQGKKESVLPLVVDLAEPTPGTGWDNAEGRSFLDRARGQFDCVLMLAVVHHLLVTHGVPLQDIVTLAGELTRKTLVVEYVGPQDRMFRKLCRGREELYASFGPEEFEAKLSSSFTIGERGQLKQSERVLYCAEKATASCEQICQP
jgi:SAM-dependent methyltransferase